ncbi:MAG TPA: NAD(P)/FAD-dependent oxidoreductase [Candidatus Sulfotelmatobacter sp.]|nr:NAD(P)/FAD-dependent oxidoreductase [Candidatus Sulfotelmatobacter sp.]
MERIDCIVIGAGVVGLAVARALALAGREVVVLEAADAIGTETSSRNSEVIHAGIYYPAGSLKAETCVAGNGRLYAYCAAHGVPHARVGKLIVATAADQMATLAEIKAKAAANGVTDLEFISLASVRQMEPELSVVGALQSPSSGIIDSHAYMLALQGDAEAHGAMIAFATPMVGGQVRDDGIELATGGAAPMRIAARLVVNSAGLHATRVAASIAGVPAASVPPMHYAKGNYFALTGKNPFRRLVYPVPEPGGLGVHVTLDMAGRCRFGPDVEWIDGIDYAVDPARAAPFYAVVRRYWPGLPDGALHPDYAGIRAKITPRGAPAADFVIQGAAEHGVAGLVNLYGIESPGLTASLAIADKVVALAVGEPTGRAA